MAAPPVIKIGPPPASKGKANDFDRFIAKHPALRQYKTAIQQWAGEFGVPALWVAATIQFESGGKNSGLNRAGRGFGLAQIDPKSWFGKVFPPTGETITQQWAATPSNAISFASWLLSRGSPASLSDAYLTNYNPGYKGTGPEGLLKGYNVTVAGRTPGQKVAGSVATAEAKAGNVALQQASARQTLDPIYLAYTGRKAPQSALNDYIRYPVSQYQLEQQLSNPKTNPLIYKSPVWQTNASKYDAYYRNIFGENKPAPRQTILYAIVHNLDATAFQNQLMHGRLPGAPDYTTSEKYLGDMADATKVYSNIYGRPDDAGNMFLKDAVLKGWNQSQIENYLRAQPEYTQSGEYKQRAIQLASAMGLIQGTGGAQTALAATGG